MRRGGLWVGAAALLALGGCGNLGPASPMNWQTAPYWNSETDARAAYPGDTGGNTVIIRNGKVIVP